MTEGKIVSIPLIIFSAALPRWPLENKCPDWDSFPSVNVDGHGLVEGCYGVKVEDESMTPVLEEDMVAVFSQTENMPALMNIYSIGRKCEVPLVRKVVKNEIPIAGEEDVSPAGRRPRRKSFMTPTPLHIPDSLVSPIADSTHQTIFLKSLANPQKLVLVPKGNLLWMHPLVLILEKGES